MEYNCQTSGNELVISISGKLTFSDMQSFRQLLTDATDSGAKRWVLDLTKVEFIDSAGLGLLLRAKAASEDNNGQVVVRPPIDGSARKALDITQFSQLISFES